MSKYAYIDHETRIKITRNNFFLQRIKKSKKGGGVYWKYEENFPNLEELALYYARAAPYRTFEGKKEVKDLIEAIKKAEYNIKKLITKLNK